MRGSARSKVIAAPACAIACALLLSTAAPEEAAAQTLRVRVLSMDQTAMLASGTVAVRLRGRVRIRVRLSARLRHAPSGERTTAIRMARSRTIWVSQRVRTVRLRLTRAGRAAVHACSVRRLTVSARAIRRLHGRRVRSAFSGDLVCARRPPELGAGANPSPNALCPVCGELPSLPPTPTPGWTTVVNDQFNVGGVPAHWHLYDGRYESDPSNCAAPSQVTVSSGYMHMRMSYRTTGSCGSGWYTGGMQLNSAYAAVNQRITVRYRIVNTDPVHVRSHRNIPMHFGGVQSPSWPAGGEVNYCEGSALTDCTMFAHWWDGTSSGSQYTGPHMRADFTQFRTLQATRLNHVISVSIDGVLKDTYVGTSATIPDVAQRAVLQQECRSAGCPSSGLSAHSEVIQIDRVTIENAT